MSDHLSETQINILDFLINKVPISDIAKHKHCSRQAIYKMIKRLQKKGYISDKAENPTIKYTRKFHINAKGRNILMSLGKTKGNEITNPDKVCEVCGFSLFVHEHHIDNNRKNNHYSNKIFLCPNHHYLIHQGIATLEITETGIKYCIYLNNANRISLCNKSEIIKNG